MTNLLLRVPFFYRLFGPKDNSSSAARDRLKQALVGDRSTVAPALMECVQKDMEDVLKRYMVFREEQVEFRLREQDGEMLLSARVPVVRIHRQAQLPEEALRESKETQAIRPSEELRLKRRKLRKKRSRTHKSQGD
ncbi:MAG: cell division topological specificity factor MinE [Candidatus Eremiobacteraeota bacterium]|nr:cell division topological specificity factor MinE [Candidatus Eremiobacteraeota bacterium]